MGCRKLRFGVKKEAFKYSRVLKSPSLRIVNKVYHCEH